MKSRRKSGSCSVSWNTGRPYGVDGQEIEAWTDGTDIVFVDHTRMIRGRLKNAAEDLEFFSMREIVMPAYDRNLYRED